jgi:hypothetical protein
MIVAAYRMRERASSVLQIASQEVERVDPERAPQKVKEVEGLKIVNRHELLTHQA